MNITEIGLEYSIDLSHTINNMLILQIIVTIVASLLSATIILNLIHSQTTRIVHAILEKDYSGNRAIETIITYLTIILWIIVYYM